jgi:hypothetical protein
MTDRIEVLQAAVYWADGYENWPSLRFTLSRKPVWEVYEKRPCSGEQLSAEQENIIGRTRSTEPTPGWHIYHADDDEFVSFFTWGGKPDMGFGGWRRTIKLTDGTTEEIIGGWHTSGDVAERAGFAPCLDISIEGWIGCFVTEERFVREVDRLLPDVEVCRHPGNDVLTVKWRDQPSKAEFMAVEHARRKEIRDGLKAKYGERNWYRLSTDDERTELDCRPYSALGACRV